MLLARRPVFCSRQRLLESLPVERLEEIVERADVERAERDVRILDIYRNAASVRIDASSWVDYLQLAKWRGRWLIVNVLWELKPKA